MAGHCAAEGFAPDFAPINDGIRGTSGGEGLLEAETSNNLNLGAVLRPGIAGISLAVDYFDITVNDQVDRVGVSNIIKSCYNLPTGEWENFCSRITRDPVTGAITEVDNR